jgi:hypothetical protein
MARHPAGLDETVDRAAVQVGELRHVENRTRLGEYYGDI